MALNALDDFHSVLVEQAENTLFVYLFIYLFYDNFATGDSLTCAILSCHVRAFIIQHEKVQKKKKT